MTTQAHKKLKNIEKELRAQSLLEAEARFRLAAIVESSDDAIISKDLDAVITSWNAAAQRIFGYTEEETVRQPITILIPPDLWDEENKILARLRRGERIEHYETIRVTKTGKKVNVSLTVSPTRDATGKIVGYSKIARDITDRKRAELELAETNERLRLAFEAGSAGGWDWDIKTGKNQWFGNSHAQLGISPAETSGSREEFWDHVHENDREHLRSAMAAAREKHGQFNEQFRVVWRDGTIHWLRSRGRFYYTANGEPERMLGISIDITDRKRAELELAEANERLRLAFEAGSAGGWDYDLKTGKGFWFGKAHAQLGMTPDETPGSREEFWQRIHEDDRERVAHALEVAKQKHEDFGEDLRVVWRDGTIHWLRARGRYQYAASGEAERSLGISLDITERKRAEEALLRHAAIVESCEDAILSVTLEGVIVTWNAGAHRMFEYAENEVVGEPVTIIVPPELPEEENRILETLRAGGCIEQFETTRVSKTGKRVNVSLSISPIKDSTGKTVGYAGIERDITKRKRAEEAVLSSEQRYRLLFERNVAGVGIGSLDGRLLDCNDGWARILGYESRDEVVGRHALEFYFNPADRQPLLDELREQAVFSRELQLKRKNGSPVWVLFNAAALNSEHGIPIVQCTMIDISESKRAEEALSGMTRKLIEAQEQERARIGRELHDDITQRLAILSVELDQPQSPTEVQSRMQELRNELRQISDDIQALSHDLHSSKLDYLGAIAGIKSWCKEITDRHKIEVVFRSDFSGNLPLDVGLPLFRVLQEAVNNSIKHSGGKRVEVQLRGGPGEIHLIVRDSGKGFDVESAMRGKGLGLTSMRERVRLLNGMIAIESRRMGGTNIHVCVPLEERSNAEPLSA